MWAMPVVAVEPRRQLCGALGRSRIGQRIGPFPQRGLDEALGLAVGPGRIGPGSEVLEPEPSAGPGKDAGAVARAVVGHHAQHADAEAGVVGERSLQEGDGALLALVGQDLGEGDARGVVEADVDELPAGTPALTGTLAGDAVADAFEAAEFLDVDVDQLAGRGPFVIGAAGIRSLSRLSPSRRRTRLTVAGETSTCLAI
jgi:hypothetical protein